MKVVAAWVMVLSLVSLTASLALADKMLCLSREELKGEETVGSCLARGEQFGVLDDRGVVRILTPQEIEVMKKVNPKFLEMRAYGLKYRDIAPELPKLPPLATPKTKAH